ncbi:Topoisomerase II-associated protein PAT1 [Kalmanozyma brasiliensis GHG001]|uniref:mRNA decay factor PAT1 domain-containing protein n=1 Tax=Kalmanozyma brasiliensis (strain GHG001) TaxID=1365824 RepID=V5ERT5_KALBG|nr:Topoisomerase II-associated protein PAT1 [Kalmanozyma brasiliensis GHG001]EST04559.1 Topoisomerase II-associated protein PAT1 [Kalmanozyma brasiliensis GHG001]
MSFFGFDTALPGDERFGKRVNRPSHQNAFDPTFDNDDTLDAKIQALAAGAQEDVEIYTWGGDGYDGLGDKLDESGDDFNADTFGDFDAGNDFDFGHAAPAPAPQQNNYNQYSQPQQPKSKFDPSNKFAASLDDFLVDPVPRFGAPRGAQQQQQQPPQQQQPRGQAKTLEEVEAEMLAMRSKQQQQPPPQQHQQPPQQPPTDRKPMTVEEVEAELRARRAAGASPAQPQQPQQPTGPPSFAAIMQSQQEQRAQAGPPQNQPPPPPPGAGNGMPPMGPGAIPPPLGPNVDPAALQAAQQQAQAAHFARMRALLEAMPPLVQQSILSLPPPMQFDSLETVAQNFPNLLDPSQRERAPTAEQDAVRFMMEKAQAQMAEFDRVEAKRKRRTDKINAMAKYNGLMSGSDKDFITRIQISQLITADPYADDFYAHIFFALRGGPPRPGMAPMPPATATGNGNQKQGGKGKQKLNKQQNAMLRMQQQVERIVQSRKDRMEKSASGAALEGALGRVSLNSAKNPRQMLQISADAAKANREKNGGDSTPDAGHARDAVRQALEGASLGGNGNADLRRDPLTKHEVLRILEKLYDLVLQLEQLRRNAPPAPPADVNPTDDAAAAAKDAFDAHQADQAAVTSTLWTELRVLEPLEISDPHPFVSLLSSAKGKRLLPRALRHLSSEQTLTALTMVVASFESLDVVRNGPLLDDLSDDPSRVDARRDAERQSETFATTIVPSMMQMASTAPMRIVSGMLALFVERNDPVRVTQTRPGVAFLTIFLSRAETLRQQGDVPAEELEQFKQIFALLFSRLTAGGKLPTLFPSTRTKQSLPFGVSYYMGSGLGQQLSAQTVGGKYRNVDLEDEPTWNLMAALAIGSTMEQQQVLVQELREKILENVISAKEWQKRNPGMVQDEFNPDIRIRNVNLLLHALNLDAAQISV